MYLWLIWKSLGRITKICSPCDLAKTSPVTRRSPSAIGWWGPCFLSRCLFVFLCFSSFPFLDSGGMAVEIGVFFNVDVEPVGVPSGGSGCRDSMRLCIPTISSTTSDKFGVRLWSMFKRLSRCIIVVIEFLMQCIKPIGDDSSMCSLYW